MQGFYILLLVVLVGDWRRARLPQYLASAGAIGGVPSAWRSRSPRSRRPRWALRAHHVEDPGLEIASFARGAGIAVLVAALLWLFYLALEPYVRRLRPWTLVSWTRLLNGGLRDAVVGRDVLIGLAFGIGLTLVSLLGARARRLARPARAGAGPFRARRASVHAAPAEPRGRACP